MAIVTPPDGAGALSVMVPLIVCVSPTDDAKVSVMMGVVTFTVAVVGTKGAWDAVMVVLPTPVGVTVTFTPELPDRTVTVGGTVAAPGLLLCRPMTWPPAPAGADSVKVNVPAALVASISGFGASAIV